MVVRAPSGSSSRHDARATPRAPDASEREACEFLSQQVEPYLRRERRTTLVRAVHSAVNLGRLHALAALPERQRRDLLEAIELRVETSRRAPRPRALVRLTSTISSAPAAERGWGRRLAAPAR